MTDIVERLREEARWQRVEYRNFGLAEEIDRGAAEIERLRAGGQREAALLRVLWEARDFIANRQTPAAQLVLASIDAALKEGPETPEQANQSNERGDSE